MAETLVSIDETVTRLRHIPEFFLDEIINRFCLDMARYLEGAKSEFSNGMICAHLFYSFARYSISNPSLCIIDQNNQYRRAYLQNDIPDIAEKVFPENQSFVDEVRIIHQEIYNKYNAHLSIFDSL